jgi:hypothetical protein
MSRRGRESDAALLCDLGEPGSATPATAETAEPNVFVPFPT